MIELKHIKLEVYGESHKEKIGLILRNIPKGIVLDFTVVDQLLSLRQKKTIYNTSRNKLDEYNVISGLVDNTTTTRPIIIEVLNNGSNSKDYNFGHIRPSHADYVGYELDKENFEYYGGGIFSGRNTVLYVIAGEICKQVINSKIPEVQVYSHLSRINHYLDKNIDNYSNEELTEIKHQNIQIIDTQLRLLIEEEMNKIDKVYSGEVTTIVRGFDRVIGGYFFDNLKGNIAGLMLSIPGSKAIKFGDDNPDNKLDILNIENEQVYLNTNYSGGINGGFTNGLAPIKFSVLYKAPSTTFEQISSIKYNIDDTYSYLNLQMGGRHDRIIANRALYAQEGLLYILLLDYLLFSGEYYG